MYYAGIDYHKRCSVVSIQDAQGQIVQEERVDHQFPEVFQRLFKECREPVSLVYGEIRGSALKLPIHRERS